MDNKSVTSSNLNGRVLNPVIDFDFIVNTDIGLIRFIRENFQDKRAFKLDILNKSDREILSLLYYRKHYNPLSIISTEDNMKDIDSLYKSFFDNYKENILKRSLSEKSIIKFVSIMFSSGSNLGINCSIVVKDQIERDQITSHFGRSLFIDISDKTSLLIKDAYYVRDFKFFEEAKIDKDVIHKKIYISPRQYVIDFIENSNTSLANSNVFILMGKDYKKGENHYE